MNLNIKKRSKNRVESFGKYKNHDENRNVDENP